MAPVMCHDEMKPTAGQRSVLEIGERQTMMEKECGKAKIGEVEQVLEKNFRRPGIGRCPMRVELVLMTSVPEGRDCGRTIPATEDVLEANSI